MRSLYWKIFLSFWIATILIIFTTAWVIQEIAQKSSIPARERLFMDSYANAAVVTFESENYAALQKWLRQTGISRQMTLYLLSNTGEIIGQKNPPDIVKQISASLLKAGLNEGMLKFGDVIVSHEILSASGKAYRLIAVSTKPLAHFVEIPWSGLSVRLAIAILISGAICYFLSLYLTQPLRSLRMAAKSIAIGKLNTRVGHFKGHHRDEIAELSDEFNRMAAQLEAIIDSKERLLQDISHELRSPLARLQIAMELGRKKSASLAEAEFNRMEMECLQLNQLIGEILEFARLDKFTNRLQHSQVNIAVLLKQIVEDAYFEFRHNKPNIVLNETSNHPLLLDKRLIHRALENIVRNALSYASSNPQIIISLYSKKNNTEICIDIEDNGPGVPKDQLEWIFNPFYRVDTSREKKNGWLRFGVGNCTTSCQTSPRHYSSYQSSRRWLINKGYLACSLK